MKESTPPLRTCTNCGQSKPATPEYFHRHRYCTGGLAPRCKACSRLRLPKRTVEQRFWAHVDKKGPDECWLWKNVDASKYVSFSIKAPELGTLAHRYSYELHHGPIPDGYVVCHSCDTPACVNPNHLWAGTQKENIADRDAKGHGPAGEASSSAKLTEAQVRTIRDLYRRGKTGYHLAEQFGVSNTSIYQIVNRQTWKHL